MVYEILEAEAKTFFAIDESTGALRTMVSLDFETKQRFEFEVRVSDRGLPRLTADSTTKVSTYKINFSRQIATSLRAHRKSNYAPNFLVKSQQFSKQASSCVRSGLPRLTLNFKC